MTGICRCPAEDTGGEHWAGCPLSDEDVPLVLRRFTVEYGTGVADSAPQMGYIMAHYGTGTLCETCSEHVDVYTEIWMQGERGVSPDQPDTMTVKECLKCFLQYPETKTILMDK